MTANPIDADAHGDRLYVYAILRSADLAATEDAARFKPVAPSLDRDPEPRLIDCGAVTVVASATDEEEILSTRRFMMGHARALEQLMTAGPVLPIRFGLVAPSAERIAAAIVAQSQTMADKLDALDGTAEFGVRVDWRRELAFSRLMDTESDLMATRDKLAKRSAQETHFARADFGRAVEGRLEEKRREAASRLAARLRPLALDAVVRDTPMDPEGDLSVLKADYLLDLSARDAFAAALDAIEAEDEALLSIKLVGPAPAYNFVNLSLDWSGELRAPSAVTSAAA